ncbi:hypothetical protein [Phenylobacterium sp.]|uniref:hypothetical protein n=1 Tax=Phenylobacterium sp. TaxID=1871053 RepID=UPI00301DBEAF
MTALSERQIEIVRTLVGQASDHVVGSLSQALSGATPGGAPDDASANALGGVRRLVEAEVADRTLRNAILQPMIAMCGPPPDDRALTFPARALAATWRGLKASEPDLIERLQAAEVLELSCHHVTDAQDRLARAAAAGLRARRNPDYAAASDVCDAARAGGADLFARCLDITPVVRRALPRLPEWITHAGKETSAGARIAYRDAVAVADDAGPLFFHMLAAQLAQRWMVMRLISAVMDKPTERYLRDSELAGFCEGLLDEIDSALATIATLKSGQGRAAAETAARVVDLTVHQILEIETTVEMPRDHGWGKRMAKQRAVLAGVVEARMREAEHCAREALPLHTPRGQKARLQAPQLSEPPQADAVERALTLLTFVDGLNLSSNYGGFSAARNKAVEALGEFLDRYVDAVLDRVRTQDVDDTDQAAAFLEIAAQFSGLIRGEKTGELVRRRAHAALNPDLPQACEA